VRARVAPSAHDVRAHRDAVADAEPLPVELEPLHGGRRDLVDDADVLVTLDIGKGVSDWVGVPAYGFLSPWYVCLSVPQIPDISMRSNAAPSSSRGLGNSCTS
jgi:hypothetical protein